MNILSGVKSLLESAKGTLSLIVLACATIAVMHHNIDGTSYAAIIGTIHAIYNIVQHRVDIARLQSPPTTSTTNAAPPDPPPPSPPSPPPMRGQL